jgi:hypothetical protein
MHHLDLGLFRYQIEFTCDLLRLQHSKHSNELVNELNYRLSEIPRYQNLKIFSNGLEIARLTANEYRSLMKVMVFVVDNLYDRNDKEVKNFISNNDLVELYVSWNEMYILSRSEEFSESDLVKFKVSKQELHKLKLLKLK